MKFRSERVPDRGSTLLEVLFAASVIGLLSTALTSAAMSVSRTTRTVSHSLEITRDIERTRNRLTADLSKYPTVDVDPTTLPQLPGSNVVTLSDDSGASATPAVVSYRYVQTEEFAHLIRFALEDSSTEVSTGMLMSTNLPLPPSGWEPGDSVVHAVTSSSEESPNGVERTIDLTFVHDVRVSVTGHLPIPSAVPTSISPHVSNAPPTIRCGGSITIVLNTSSSTWSQGAAATITGDILNFVKSLRGTPSHIRIVGFDRSAYSLHPESPVGSFLDVLDPATSLTSLSNRLSSLSSSSTGWYNGRNWEDGISQATRRDIGTLYAQLPNLIIFLTDGSPNRNRTNTSTDTDTTFHPLDLSRAVSAADLARATGASLIGILLGSGADATATSHLTSVFGPRVWEGGGEIEPLDRSRTFARPASEGFGRLDEILGLIARWRCAGTLTLHQRILSGGVVSKPTDGWTFSVTTSDDSDAITESVDSRRPSATIDLGVGGSSEQRDVSIAQTQPPGYRHHSAACTAGGTPLDTSSVTDVGGVTTVRVPASPTTAVSCVLTSEISP